MYSNSENKETIKSKKEDEYYNLERNELSYILRLIRKYIRKTILASQDEIIDV